MISSGSFIVLGLMFKFEIREHDTSSFVLSQDGFGYMGSFVIPTNFRIVFSISVKNAIGILIGIILNLLTALHSMDSLTILIHAIHQHGIYFHLFVSFF